MLIQLDVTATETDYHKFIQMVCSLALSHCLSFSLSQSLYFNCIALMNISVYQLIAFTLSDKHVIELYRFACIWSRLQQNKACDLLNEWLHFQQQPYCWECCIVSSLHTLNSSAQSMLCLAWRHVAHLLYLGQVAIPKKNFEEITLFRTYAKWNI